MLFKLLVFGLFFSLKENLRLSGMSNTGEFQGAFKLSDLAMLMSPLSFDSVVFLRLLNLTFPKIF
jgi:hypothetical protein